MLNIKKKYILFLLSLISLSAVAQKSIFLFDGKTLAGWKSVGGNALFKVENGAIVGTMTKGIPNSFLVTDKEYGDYVLELDVKLEGETTNSGIQTRSHIDAGGNNGRGLGFR